MKTKIRKEIMNRIKNNGGVWCEIVMKRTGEYVHIGRRGLSGFENLELDRFDIAIHGRIIASKIEAEKIADVILKLA